MESHTQTTVVRFNGGPQAGHNVMTPDGLQHKFSHFGSGTLVQGVRTHLSRFMLCSPWCMIVEEETLASIGVTDAMERTTISENCVVITPFHRVANRLRERARGKGRHGSCGIGFGETMKDSLELPEDLIVRMRDFRDIDALAEKLERIRLHKLQQLREEGVLDIVRHMRDAVDEIDELVSTVSVQVALQVLGDFVERVRIVPDSYLAEILAGTQETWVLVDLGLGDQGKGTTVDFLARTRSGAVIFEPAQGVLLDEWRGFHPHTTWSTCTFQNADMLLSDCDFSGKVYRLGILRAYATRHGAGPFVTESAELGAHLPEFYGDDTIWTGDFRVGYFDAVAARYAIECCGGIDAFHGLVVTCVDRLERERELKFCAAYDTAAIRGSCQAEFVTNGSGIVFNMRLGELGDLEHQQRLTRCLEQVGPMYHSVRVEGDFERAATNYLMRIQEELHIPIVLTSWGPTADDKHWDPLAPMVLGEVARVA